MNLRACKVFLPTAISWKCISYQKGQHNGMLTTWDLRIISLFLIIYIRGMPFIQCMWRFLSMAWAPSKIILLLLTQLFYSLRTVGKVGWKNIVDCTLVVFLKAPDWLCTYSGIVTWWRDQYKKIQWSDRILGSTWLFLYLDEYSW